MGGQLYFVYILTNKWRTVLYTGMTNNLIRRVLEHINKVHPGSFSGRYRVNILVYFEVFDNPTEAIMREKQIKARSRKAKEALINSRNPEWRDLYSEISAGKWPW